MADLPPAQVRDTFEALATAVAAAGRAGQAQAGGAVGAAPVLRELADALDAHQAVLDRQLFPALFESVAGSDPVCIRGMQRHLAALHRELSGCLWTLAADGQGGAQQRERLLSGCAQYMAYQREDVFPMAGRMLDG